MLRRRVRLLLSLEEELELFLVSFLSLVLVRFLAKTLSISQSVFRAQISPSSSTEEVPEDPAESGSLRTPLGDYMFKARLHEFIIFMTVGEDLEGKGWV